MLDASFWHGKFNAYCATLVASTLAAVAACGCRDRADSKPTPIASAPIAPARDASTRAAPASSPAPRASSSAPSSVASAMTLKLDPDAGAPGGDEVELGPIAPAGLGSFGAVVLSGDDEVVVAPLRDGRLEKPAASIKTSQAPWPAVVDGSPARVYWVSKGRLVLRKVSTDGVVAPVEVLADDAADGNIVAAAGIEGGPDVVAYIARRASKDEDRVARLWIDGKGSQPLSAEGAGASAVSVAAVGPRKAAIVSFDGRLALSPVHARYLELSASGATKLSDDQVVFMGGSAEGQLHLATVRASHGPITFAALSRDTTTFGLVALSIPPADGEAASAWLMYPNGVTPAPVAAASLCGKTAIAWVQPEDASPSARKSVVVGLVQDQGRIADPWVVASADKVRNLAFSAIKPLHAAKGPKGRPPLGGMALFASDGTLRARAVSCR